ncbi:hypothetical protein KY290_028175 [Solanum tuberosum]|uniref:Uncharacterized protein n=1 Tax=Solanum tuberosum TaxID=4113 RepID=A0ABQ7UJ12_SOLTU|nr:hypothetical protein KY290_028175 [Solanum tuberosum]
MKWLRVVRSQVQIPAKTKILVIGGYYMVMIVDGDDYKWWLVVMTVGCGTHSKKATTSLEKLTKEANKAEQTTKALDFVPSEIVVPLSTVYSNDDCDPEALSVAVMYQDY